MSECKASYLETMGLNGPIKKSARQAALNRAHAIRQFEIDLYWKRANYFWLLQAAVFAAFGLTWKSGAGLPVGVLPVGLAALGLVTSVAGYLAARGSKFWQRNWEHHIDMLEGEFEGALYKVIYIRPDGGQWSLSRVSQSLALCFAVFWGVTLLVVSFAANSNWSLKPTDLVCAVSLVELATIACWAMAASGTIFLFCQRSDLTGTTTEYCTEKLALNAKPDEANAKDIPEKPYILRREPRIE